MWRGKRGQKSVTSGHNFKQCENYVKMRAWFEELAEPGHIIDKVWTWLTAYIREVLSSKSETTVDDESLILIFFFNKLINFQENELSKWAILNFRLFLVKLFAHAKEELQTKT